MARQISKPSASAIAKTITELIDYGIASSASDIHIEPREALVAVRYRIDGLLREAHKLPRAYSVAVTRHIKSLAGLSLSGRHMTQDASFNVSYESHPYQLHVSIIPTLHGEKIVLHIFSTPKRTPSFNELGLWGNALTEIKHAIVQPHGLLLVVGPKGSGKATTLHTILSSIQAPNRSIATLEAPIKYHLNGAQQTPFKPDSKTSFSQELGAIVRHHPDILMSSNIPDRETADVLFEADAAKQLVFATLPTASAALALTQLHSMGIESSRLATTIRVVIGQRLIRRLCKACRESYIPEHNLMKYIGTTFRLSALGSMHAIQELEAMALAAGLGTTTSPKKAGLGNNGRITGLWRARPGGCSQCNYIGYKGRVGIFEVLCTSNPIQHLLIAERPYQTIETAAMGEGMLTMQQDGFIKALCGETTIEEIVRVTQPGFIEASA